MSVPERSQVVIACPNCGTRYQLAYATIGAKGRTVACANCGQSWEAHAAPPGETDFSALAEAALDEKMIAEERRQQARREASLAAQATAREARKQSREAARAAAEARAAAKAGVVPPSAADATSEAGHQLTLEAIRAAVAIPAAAAPSGTPQRRHDDLALRPVTFDHRSPSAQLRRLGRIGTALALVGILGGGIIGRGVIVEQFPALAGVYAALGLGVNVVGLEFADVRTLRSLSEGRDVLIVSGHIRSVARRTVALPQVIVTLIGAAGESLYEWSVEPQTADLEPGESISFETRLTAPPANARDVRLTFANARSQSPTARPGTRRALPPPATATAKGLMSGPADWAAAAGRK